MAAEREQKLRSQHSHYNHAILKAADYVTANEIRCPKFPKKRSTSGQWLPKNSIPVVDEEKSIEDHKKLRGKVCIILYTVVCFIFVKKFG